MTADPVMPERDKPGSLQPHKPVHEISWTDLAARIQTDDAEAMVELYRILNRGTRSFLLRSLGPQEADDLLHEAFLAVVERIRQGELREPSALLSFALSTLRHKVAGQIGKAARRRKTEIDWDQTEPPAESAPDPEQLALVGQRRELADEILNQLIPRDREILIRFYVLEHDRVQICADMGLTETQFRLYKSRAKARVGRLWSQRMAHPRKRSASA